MDQNPDISEQRSEATWQHRAEMALASVIDADRLITYAELADAAAIPPPHRIHKLTAWLETTMRKDHAAKKPLRAALVISRNRDGLPAPGFFILCGELGVYEGGTSGQCATQFHKTTINRLWGRSNS